MWLGRSDTVQDDLFMVHEFIHHLNLLPVNQNKDVEIKIELNNQKAESDVYGNSVFEIEFPEYVRNLEHKKRVVFDTTQP